MSFEELKEVFVDTLNCDADKVTMEASLTDDLQADSLDAATDSSAAVTSRRASPAAAAISSMVGSRPSCFSSVSRACMAR